MEIIDAHVHLYPPEINRDPAGWAAAHGEKHWATLCARVRKNGFAVQAFPGVDGLLRAMDAAGVSRAILQGWYWERAESCALQNDFYERCVRAHPDRLGACAALHPGAGVPAVREGVKRAAGAGFAGLGELSPHSQDVMRDGAAKDALSAGFELAGELGLAVCLHVTETAGEAGARNYPGKVETPLGDFVRWAEAHPKTNFVLAHWGARLPFDAEWGAAARKLPNIYYDTAASPLIYGPSGSAAIWREMAGAAGADHIMFGTDFPLVLHPKKEKATPEMASLAEEARASGLGEAELAAIFSNNTKRVFI